MFTVVLFLLPLIVIELILMQNKHFYVVDKQLYAELYERIGIAVDTQNSGSGHLTAETNGPRGNLVATDVSQEEQGSYTVSFTPAEIGEYHTKVFWNDKQIQGSPFLVWVC